VTPPRLLHIHGQDRDIQWLMHLLSTARGAVLSQGSDAPANASVDLALLQDAQGAFGHVWPAAPPLVPKEEAP
jgi:hypothetical protein